MKRIMLLALLLTHRTRKQWTSKAALLGTLVFLLSIGAQAQEAPSIKNTQTAQVASGGSNTAKEDTEDIRNACILNNTCTITDKMLKLLQPNLRARFARGFQYTYEVNEQPGTVVLPNGTFIKNPEHYLQKHSLTFKFGELFPSELLARVKRDYDYVTNNVAKGTEPIQLEGNVCGSTKLGIIKCLTNGGSWWQRALTGVSVTGGLSERQAVQQGFLITDQTFTKHYQITGAITFDPTKLFITATNWKNTLDVAQKMPRMFDANEDLAAAARDALNQKTPWEFVFIPKIQLKRESQFDFIKYQGTLIAAPFPERALNSLILSWDLTHVIADTKTRIDADAMRDYEKPKVQHTSEQQGAKLCVTILGTSKSYISVPLTFNAESCHELAKNIKADQYALACELGDHELGDHVQIGPRINAAEAPDDTKKPNPNSCRW